MVCVYCVCEVALLENGYRDPTGVRSGIFRHFIQNLWCVRVQVSEDDPFLHIMPNTHTRTHTIRKDRLLTFTNSNIHGC